MNANAASSPRLPTLDGLRAVAVGIVMLSHVAHSGGAPLWLAQPARLLTGEIGVLIFFTISGFIITHLLLREQARQGRISLRAFWYRRALRILPPLLVLLAVLQGLHWSGWIRVSPTSQWASVFFIRNHVSGGWFNGHLWSLSVEEQFYVVWPLVMVGALTRGWQLPFKWMIASTVLVRGLLAWRGQLTLASYGLIGNVDALLLGCWGAWYLAGKAVWPNRWFQFISRRWPAMLLVIMALSLVKSTRLALPAQTLLPWVVGSTTIAVIVANLKQREAWLFRALNKPWLAALGRMSYSLYLWQQLFLCPAGAWIRDAGPLTRLPVNLGCALLAGWLSYCWIERTAQRLRASDARSGETNWQK